MEMDSSNKQDTFSKPDIWSAERYGKTVAPFVSQLTTTIVRWLDPQRFGGCRPMPLSADILHLMAC